jgi:hypothetical protein
MPPAAFMPMHDVQALLTQAGLSRQFLNGDFGVYRGGAFIVLESCHALQTNLCLLDARGSRFRGAVVPAGSLVLSEF